MLPGFSRRDFLLAATAFAAVPRASFAAPEHVPGAPWPGWRRGEFQVHLIYTGVAESQFLIFPDGTSLLLDCGDFAAVNRGELALPVLPSAARHAGEWIARYVRRVNPRGDHVDYMLLSHFHQDHAGTPRFHAGRTKGREIDYFLSGFAQAAEFLHFDIAIDRGWPDYADPIPLADDYQGGVLRNMKALYRHLERRDGLRVEKFRLGAADQLVMRHGGEGEGFRAFNFCGNGRIADERTGKITDLYAEAIATYHPKVLNENGMSLGTLFHVGSFTYYTAGDFSDNLRRADGKKRQIEDDLAAVMPRVSVAKINHHGHASMFGPLASALDAPCYVAAVWDQLHCSEETMAALEATPSAHRYYPGYVPDLAIKKGTHARPGWMEKVPKALFAGGHVVITVPPGGTSYTMTVLAAADESLRILDEATFAVLPSGGAEPPLSGGGDVEIV